VLLFPLRLRENSSAVAQGLSKVKTNHA